jgi:hypothetical protein
MGILDVEEIAVVVRGVVTPGRFLLLATDFD